MIGLIGLDFHGRILRDHRILYRRLLVYLVVYDETILIFRVDSMEVDGDDIYLLSDVTRSGDSFSFGYRRPSGHRPETTSVPSA